MSMNISTTTTSKDYNLDTITLDRINNKFTIKNFFKKGTYIIALTIITLISATVIAYNINPQFELYRTTLLSHTFGQIITILGVSLLVIELVMFLYMLYLYTKHKPATVTDDTLLPQISIIVPAYNEGELVYHTLQSLVNSNYPAELMQIIAIDDGSKDDTYEWLVKAQQIFGNRITLFKQPTNMGKRHALYKGFNIATGDIFITVDSDSVIDKNTLRNMVAPFLKDEKCGAVAGNVKVLNHDNNLLGKMLQVSFAYSFEFVRTAQSTIGSVLCTPGALAAYKKEPVMNCLEEWLHQKFLGKASDIGEDRAITNMILKQGHTIKFQQNAVVYTNTPETYKGLTKMYTRWERSNVRENIAMSKFIFKNFRTDDKSGIRIMYLHQMLRMLMSLPILIFMLYFIISAPILFLTSTLIGILIFSSIQSIFYALKRDRKYAIWAYTYSILFAFGLFWISPYALISARKGGWLTR